MKKTLYAFLTVLLAIGINGPASAANFGSANLTESKVRVIHASPDAPGVDILVNDTLPAFEGLTFGEITEYATLPANVYNTKVVPEGKGPGDAVINADLNLFYSERYTVLAVNDLGNIEPLVLRDDFGEVQAWRGKVRFVHASPDAPAVDIKVKNGPYWFEAISFKGVGDYVSIPSGTYDLEVRLAGTETVVLELPGIEIRPMRAYTAYAIGFARSTPGLTAIISMDSNFYGGLSR